MKITVVVSAGIVSPERGRFFVNRPAPACEGTGKCKLFSRKRCMFACCTEE